jgi:hypothetical protein
MKIKLILLTTALVVSSTIHSQTENFTNKKKQWFFGAEVGTNHILSYCYNEPTNSFQGGLFAEYYLKKNWSVTGRLKYFKIGQSSGIIYNDYNSTVDLKNYFRFDGEVISLPLNLKWEYKIAKNFSGNLKTGVALNYETKRIYHYQADMKTNYPPFFIDYNLFGAGFNYYISNNAAIYIESEIKGLGRERLEGPVFLAPLSTDNLLFNIGIKHRLKSH